jgi:hypothetical protein
MGHLMVCLDFPKEQPLWESCVECTSQIVSNFFIIFQIEMNFVISEEAYTLV